MTDPRLPDVQLSAETFGRLLSEHGLSIPPDDQAAALAASQNLLAQAERVSAALQAAEADDDAPL